MKEIKFRAWIKEKAPIKQNQMVYSPELCVKFGFASSVNGIGIIIRQFGIPSKRYKNKGHNIKMKDCELMQFTGLKDKNGKEIYEGDIVDTRYGKYIVMWDDYNSGFHPFTFSSNAPKSNTETEVIGNIYENPNIINYYNIYKIIEVEK